MIRMCNVGEVICWLGVRFWKYVYLYFGGIQIHKKLSDYADLVKNSPIIENVHIHSLFG